MTRPLLSLALVVAVIALGSAVPTPSEGRVPLSLRAAFQADHGLRGAPQGSERPATARPDGTLGQRVSGGRLPADSPRQPPRSTGGVRPVSGAPTGSVGSALIGGWISWADPDLGGDYLATRFPRGTLVRLCTPNRCIVRRSNDFGPSDKIDPPRIADLAVLDWESLCNLPRARGLCMGTVETVDEIPLPATDTAK